MRLPRAGTWCLVLWIDAQRADGWHDADEEQVRTIEVSAGMCRGRTLDKRLRIASTVSLGLENGAIHASLGELEIPIGCIVGWTRIPPPAVPDENPVDKRRRPDESPAPANLKP